MCTEKTAEEENDPVCVKAIRSISIIVCECLYCVCKNVLVWTQALTGNETVEVTVLFKTNWLRKLCLCCQILPYQNSLNSTVILQLFKK